MPAPSDSGSSRSAWLGLLSVAGIFVVYPSVLNHDFLNYDDDRYVSENVHVQRGLTLASLRWAFTTTTESNWHPITWLSHMLDWQLFGSWAGGHHLVNVLLHAANALLLFAVLRRATGASGRSAFVAALFAWHPLHVESVAWVAERKDVLSTLFAMLALGAYVRYAERPTVGRYVPVSVLLAFGLMAKPMLVTLPFVLLLLDVWPLGRLARGGGPPTGAQQPNGSPGRRPRPGIGGLLAEKLLLFMLAAVSSAITILVHRGSGTLTPAEQLPLALRVANALIGYVTYIRKMLLPVDLACLYPMPATVSVWRVAAAAIVLAAISWLVVRLWRERPYLLVGWCWFVGTLVPVIGLVQVGAQAMADRYTYVPLIGLFIMVAWGAHDVLGHSPHRTSILRLAAALTGAACLALTWFQVAYWRDSATLFTHALRVTSANDVAHHNLGLELSKRGRSDDAVAHYEEALRINPAYAQAHHNLGRELRKQGRLAEAIAHYAEALRLNPAYAEASNSWGVALRQQGQIAGAEARFVEAVRLKPDYAVARLNLGTTLLEEGRGAEALTQLERAAELQPDSAAVHYNLGNALVQQGDRDRARTHFEAALRLQPDFWQVHYNLAGLLAERGELDGAIVHYSEALRGNPLLAAAYQNRSVAYRRKGDIERADADLARARELGARP